MGREQHASLNLFVITMNESPTIVEDSSRMDYAVAVAGNQNQQLLDRVLQLMQRIDNVQARIGRRIQAARRVTPRRIGNSRR